MNCNIEFKGLAPQIQTQNLIKELITKLEKKTKRFSPDEMFLRLLVEENSTRKLFRVSNTLELPQKTLAAQEERHHLEESVREAFAEIERQVEAHKASLRGEPMWKRRERRKA
jgi:ribosome-associated translation inhibitor RaiA